MAALRRMGRVGTCSLRCRAYLGAASSSSSVWFPWSREFDSRQISTLVRSNGKRLFLVDTLALVRKLEAGGVPSKQAEAITAAITQVLNDSLENVSQTFVSSAKMEKTKMLEESNLSKFKSEVQSSQRIKKLIMRCMYEVDKVTAGQRLDLNLERGRIRDELANQNAETSNLTNKLDREIHTLRAELEAAKYEVIK